MRTRRAPASSQKPPKSPANAMNYFRIHDAPEWLAIFFGKRRNEECTLTVRPFHGEFAGQLSIPRCAADGRDTPNSWLHVYVEHYAVGMLSPSVLRRLFIEISLQVRTKGGVGWRPLGVRRNANKHSQRQGCAREDRPESHLRGSSVPGCAYIASAKSVHAPSSAGLVTARAQPNSSRPKPGSERGRGAGSRAISSRGSTLISRRPA